MCRCFYIWRWIVCGWLNCGVVSLRGLCLICFIAGLIAARVVDLDAGLFSEITVCGVSCFGLLRCLGCVWFTSVWFLVV